MNHSIAENFMRSAKAPAISAGVMMAKVIWKHMKTDSGIVLASSCTLSTRQAAPGRCGSTPPMHGAAAAVKARL